MKPFLNRLYQTIIAGLFLLLPLSVLVVVLLKIFDIVHPLIVRLSAALGVHGIGGVRLLVIVIFIVICLLAGLLVRAQRVSGFREWLERNVLVFIPGYEYIRMRMAETFGQDAEATDRSVLARIDDGWAPGMLIERGADGRCVVFMPDVPQYSSGAVYIVEADQVKFLHVRYGKLNDSIRSYGKGLLAMEVNSRKP